MQYIRNKLFENLTLKVIALVLAIIIWFFVVGEKKSEVRLTVPLELRNLPEQMEIVDQSHSQAEVVIRGFSSVVKRLTPGDIDVHIDLSNVRIGTNSFALSPNDITVPVGTTVLQVSPAEVAITLDATTTKMVPIKPVMRGSPAQGYVVEDVTVKPETVQVVGAQHTLKTLNKIETEAVVINNTSRELEKKVKLKLPNGIRLAGPKQPVVTVTVDIVPNMIDLFFEDIPLRVQDESRSFTLSLPTITALLHGPELTLSQMTPSDIKAFIETSGLPEGQSTVEPVFQLPENVTVKRYFPKTIILHITKEE